MNFIRRELVPKGIDTVYVLGNAANEELFAEVAHEIDDVFDVHRTHKYKASLRDPKGAEFEAGQALFILRRRGASVFQPS